MIKIYHLSSCSTCVRIIKEINLPSDALYQNIKTEKIQVNEIEEMREMAGSYEALFSRKAMKYKSMGLKDKNLSESDYKQLILDEYTFLKRPVIIIDNQIFIGNSKKNVEAIIQFLNESKN